MRYLSIRREIEGSLPTVAELLRQKGEQDALRAMSQADIEITEVGYDNWNGGTELWTVFLRVPVSVFMPIEARRGQIARIVSKHLELVTGRDNGDWMNAEISPMRAPPLGVQSRHLVDRIDDESVWF